MDRAQGLSWLTPRRRRDLRLALLLSVFIWLFVRPLRDAISLWIPFAALAGIELHFFASGLNERRRSAGPLDTGHREQLDWLARDDLVAPRRADRDEVVFVDDRLATDAEDVGPDESSPVDDLGAEEPRGQRRLPAWLLELAAAALTASWLFVDAVRTTVPALLVLAAASLLAARLLARAVFTDGAHAVRRRHPVLVHLRQAAIVAAVAGAIFLLVRPTGWDALGATRQAAAQTRFSRESSRLTGRPVTVVCDSKGVHTGVLNDADGSAVVGGRTAWLDPRICLTLYDLAFAHRVDSFDSTSWAILVLAHESWHLRGQRNEGITNCYGMQSGVQLGQALGLSASEAAHMMRYRYEINLSEFSLGRAEYMLPPECKSGGQYDLDPVLKRFP